MEHTEIINGFSKIDYKWDKFLRISIIPYSILFYFSIFLTDSPSAPLIAYIPMNSFYVYIVYFIIYSVYKSSKRKDYKLNKIELIKIPLIFKITPILLISLFFGSFILWGFLS